MWRWQSQLVTFLGSHHQSWLVSQNVVIEHQEAQKELLGTASGRTKIFHLGQCTWQPQWASHSNLSQRVSAMVCFHCLSHGCHQLIKLWEKHETGVCLLVKPNNSQSVYSGLPLLPQHVYFPKHISWKLKSPPHPEVLTSDEKGKCHQLGWQKGLLDHVIHHKDCLLFVQPWHCSHKVHLFCHCDTGRHMRHHFL